MHTRPLLDHVLVPVADVADARRTAAALAPFDPSHVTVLYVVEKASGAIDPVPGGYLEEEGEDAVGAFREVFPDADERITWGEDPIGAIYDVASEVDATAVAYRSRGGSRLVRLLSGDGSLELVEDPPLPIVSLPEASQLG